MRQENRQSKKCTCNSSKASGVLLLLVQSSMTIVILVLVWFLKSIDSQIYNQMEGHFKNAMIDTPELEREKRVDIAVQTVSTPTNTVVSVKHPQQTSSTPKDAMRIEPPLKKGILTSRYGKRIDPISGQEGDLHEGVDIAAADGTELSAMTNGIVKEVGYEEAGYGHYLIVSCDDGIHEFLYAHCASVEIKTGDMIQCGETVAFVGNSGRSTGSHVHVEWRRNKTPIDPLTVLPEGIYA